MKSASSPHSTNPLVIAHRGASGLLPEQTLEAFDLAIDQGADAIELDVVLMRDDVLLARHENELSRTTNIADRPEFASRRATKSVDGQTVTGWFTEDFLTSELGSLRARQRFEFRDHSSDDRFALPTLHDALDWLLIRRRDLGRKIKIFVEIKHPTHFSRIGFDIAKIFSHTVAFHGLQAPDSGLFAMSFETQILRDLRHQSDLMLVQLIDATDARPFDWTTSGDSRTYADMITSDGLAQIAHYANGIGPWKRLIVPARRSDADGANTTVQQFSPPTTLIADAHAAGLLVCPWTFRDEPQYVAPKYGGGPEQEYEQFFALGVDAVISDFPKTAVAARTRCCLQ